MSHTNTCLLLFSVILFDNCFFFFMVINIQSIGAINCIIRRPTDGKLFGFNTDYVGAISAIEDGLTGLIMLY